MPATRPRWIVLALAFAGALACARKNAPDAPDAPTPPRASDDASAPTASAPAAPAPAPPHEPDQPRPPAGEAPRVTLASPEADPRLRPHADAIRARFGEAARGLAMQEVPLDGGLTAVLLATPDESASMVLALDGARLAWSKERPTAGLVPPARALTLAPHPLGGAVLFAYDAPTKRVAARVWSADGSPFADFEVMEQDACAALTAAYFPARGWIVVCAATDGPRAALLHEDGTRAWGKSGVVLGYPWDTPAPVSVVVDTARSFVVVQRGQTGHDARSEILASRYDPSGRPLWDAPARLGTVDAQRLSPRIAARRARDGVVRVELGGAGRGGAAEVDADGHVTRP